MAVLEQCLTNTDSACCVPENTGWRYSNTYSRNVPEKQKQTFWTFTRRARKNSRRPVDNTLRRSSRRMAKNVTSGVRDRVQDGSVVIDTTWVVVCGAGSMKRSSVRLSVRPSVRLSHRSTAAACDGFAAERSVGNGAAAAYAGSVTLTTDGGSWIQTCFGDIQFWISVTACRPVIPANGSPPVFELFLSPVLANEILQPFQLT